MLLTKLKREAIVKSDFSTFGYKFSLENQDEYPHNEAASVISTLIEFDVRKLTHGFLTFVDVERKEEKRKKKNREVKKKII
jgi:hypothetical protein